jgi:hypothetical protein
MFQGSSYLFAIQDKDFRFWKVEDGVVKCTAAPYFLDFAPAGWQEIAIQNIRNKKYWGIDRSVTIPLSYVNDGAQILKYIFLNKGTEEPVSLSILEQQLYYEPYPAATIAYTSGQSPFTPNTTTTGTITGTPGEIVTVKVYLENPDLYPDLLIGNFDGFNFTIHGVDNIPPFYEIYNITIPPGGVINFNIAYTKVVGSTSSAGLEIINANNLPPGYGYWYKQRFRGEFDLTTYSHEGAKVKCTTLEDGLAKYLKSNEAVFLELPLDVDEAVTVKLDGIKLHEKANYVDTPGVIFSPTALGGGYDRGLTTTIFLNNEGDHVGISLENQFQSGYASTFPDTVTAANCLMHNVYNVPVVLSISGTSEFTCVSQNGTWAFRRRFLLTSSDFPTQDDYEYHDTGTALSVGVTYTQAFTETITLPPGERLYTQSIFFGGVSGNPGVEFTDNSKFKIEFTSRYEPTYVKGFKGQYLWDKYISHVTEGTYSAAISDFLTINSDKVFTCGNALRGFEDAVLKWNFEGFFQFWDSFTSVGITEQGGVIDIAEKKNLIDLTDIIELPEPSNLGVRVADDYLYSTLKIGYLPIKNDIGVLNGNQEFNTEFQFSLGLMKKPAELDKVSKISASSYSIEKTRVTTINKETTDYKADNDVFVLAIIDKLIISTGNPDPYYELDRTLNASATGLIEPETIFNLPLSPHLNLLRNGPELRSRLWLCDTKTLAYRTADKNNAVTFTHPSYGFIEEKANENIGGLGDQFFVPIIFDITIPPPNDLISLLDANPLKIYRFPFYGNYYTGILVEVSTGLAAHTAQNWKLLALPDNDFKKLEAYYG